MAESPRDDSILRRYRWSVLALVLGVGNLLAVLAKAAQNETFGIDFGVFHAGGALIELSGFDRAYDQTAFSEYFTAEYFPSLVGSTTVSHFISTPVFGWFAQALSLLPFGPSFVLWLALGGLALIPAIRMLGLPRWVPAIVLVSPMMALNTSLGQTGAFVLLLFALIHVSMVDRQLVRCGLLAGLLILKPPLAFGYGLLWLVQARRYWSAIATSVGTGLVLAIPTLVSGLGPWQGFLDAMTDRTDLESSWSQQSASVPEFLKLALPLAPSWVTVMTWVIGLLVALAVIVEANRRFGDDPELMSSAAVIATVLASPHLLVYDSLILVIPAAVAYRRGLLTGDRAGVLAVITTASLVLGPALYEVQYSWFGRGIGVELPALAMCVWLLVKWHSDAELSGSSVPVLPNASAVDRQREDLVVGK